MKKFKKVRTKMTFKFRNWFRVDVDEVTTPNGSTGEYNVIRMKPFPIVVPIDEDGRITFIKLHRYTTGSFSIELPAGHTDGQTLLEAGKRELREETGLIAEEWKAIGSFYEANGLADDKAVVFVARGLEKVGEPIEMDNETIVDVFRLSLEEFKNYVVVGEITDAGTICAITKAEYSGEFS